VRASTIEQGCCAHANASAVRRGIALCAMTLFLICAAVDQPCAQDRYPAQAIEMVVTFGPGGGLDTMARRLAQLLEPLLNGSLFVTNVVGASGNSGLTKLLNNPADGYTIATLSSFTISAWASGIGYARPEDFIVLGTPQESPSMLFVPFDSQFKTFLQLLEFARANPGRLKVATAGSGTNDDITLRYFTGLGYRMANVPYAKPADRYASPFRKRTHAIYEEPGDVADLLAKSRLRPLVVFDRRRHPAFPDIPASTELGFDLIGLTNTRMLVARSGTPAEVVAILAAAIERALATPEWRKHCDETFSCTTNYALDEAKERIKEVFEARQEYLKHLGSGAN